MQNTSFIEKRTLSAPFATSLHVSGLIVGAVISAEYTGFSTGLSFGFGSFVCAHIVTCILVILSSLSLVELTTAFPFASGSTSFANASFGNSVAFVIGMFYTLQSILFVSTYHF